LAFDTTTLKEKTKNSGFILGKCIYQTTLQEQIIDDAMKYVQTPSSDEERITDNLWHVLRFIPFFKHQSFCEEKEWRLVCVRPVELPQTKFRRGKSMVIPHTSIPIGEGENSSLCGVRVGPCPHMALSVSSVRKMLAQKNIPPTLVEGSSIPFRDW
jgi:hypothetical protein